MGSIPTRGTDCEAKMGWKSTVDISKAEAIQHILEMLESASDEAVANVLETLVDGCENPPFGLYGHNFMIVSQCPLSVMDSTQPCEGWRRGSIPLLDAEAKVEEPWYVGVDSPFSTYRAKDTVVATVDFNEYNAHDRCHDRVAKGETDIVESVSSDHHGGLQLNLVKHGRGWSNHVWRKLETGPVV